jgi:asparagine synthase (glutamine-hydrolysing)
MTDTIAHRGPDGEGQWVNEQGNIGLGHRRLSILDLSDAGSQPMHFKDRYTIVFNGEIYNYVEIRDQLKDAGYNFTSGTDTEVIMAAYDAKGKSCLSDFDGMFSIALYDKKKRELFCARDRFGEKPFYYYLDGNQFVFGSEIKTIWSQGVSRVLLDMAVYNYVVSNKPIGETKSETFYKNIYQLKPSHSMTISVDDVKVNQERYWKLSTIQKNIKVEDAIDQFQSLFSQSIDRRLRSDVPVGSSLSGGLDSSMVVGYMARNRDITQNTFSAAFPGFERDESLFQKMMVDRINTNHHVTSPDMATNMANFDKILYHQEEPFSSLSIAIQYEVFKMARANNVTVLLDGQGADEILAGYSFFTFSYLRELALKRKLGAAIQTANKAANKQAKSTLYFLGGAMSSFIPRRIVDRFKSADQSTARGLLNPDFAKQFADLNESDLEIHNSLNDALDHRTNTIGLDQLLRYCDRNAMAHSVEVRLPFLNHNLVEYIFSLPSEMKINEGWTKWIARKAAQSYVPEEIIWRKEKIAYESPDNFLFGQREHPELQEVINSVDTLQYFKKDEELNAPKLYFRKLMISKILTYG